MNQVKLTLILSLFFIGFPLWGNAQGLISLSRQYVLLTQMDRSIDSKIAFDEDPHQRQKRIAYQSLLQTRQLEMEQIVLDFERLLALDFIQGLIEIEPESKELYFSLLQMNEETFLATHAALLQKFQSDPAYQNRQDELKKVLGILHRALQGDDISETLLDIEDEAQKELIQKIWDDIKQKKQKQEELFRLTGKKEVDWTFYYRSIAPGVRHGTLMVLDDYFHQVNQVYPEAKKAFIQALLSQISNSKEKNPEISDANLSRILNLFKAEHERYEDPIVAPHRRGLSPLQSQIGGNPTVNPFISHEFLGITAISFGYGAVTVPLLLVAGPLDVLLWTSVVTTLQVGDEYLFSKKGFDSQRSVGERFLENIIPVACVLIGFRGLYAFSPALAKITLFSLASYGAVHHFKNEEYFQGAFSALMAAYVAYPTGVRFIQFLRPPPKTLSEPHNLKIVMRVPPEGEGWEGPENFGNDAIDTSSWGRPNPFGSPNAPVRTETPTRTETSTQTATTVQTSTLSSPKSHTIIFAKAQETFLIGGIEIDPEILPFTIEELHILDPKDSELETYIYQNPEGKIIGLHIFSKQIAYHFDEDGNLYAIEYHDPQNPTRTMIAARPNRSVISSQTPTTKTTAPQGLGFQEIKEITENGNGNGNGSEEIDDEIIEKIRRILDISGQSIQQVMLGISKLRDEFDYSLKEAIETLEAFFQKKASEEEQKNQTTAAQAYVEDNNQKKEENGFSGIQIIGTQKGRFASRTAENFPKDRLQQLNQFILETGNWPHPLEDTSLETLLAKLVSDYGGRKNMAPYLTPENQALPTVAIYLDIKRLAKEVDEAISKEGHWPDPTSHKKYQSLMPVIVSHGGRDAVFPHLAQKSQKTIIANSWLRPIQKINRYLNEFDRWPSLKHKHPDAKDLSTWISDHGGKKAVYPYLNQKNKKKFNIKFAVLPLEVLVDWMRIHHTWPSQTAEHHSHEWKLAVWINGHGNRIEIFEALPEDLQQNFPIRMKSEEGLFEDLLIRDPLTLLNHFSKWSGKMPTEDLKDPKSYQHQLYEWMQRYGGKQVKVSPLHRLHHYIELNWELPRYDSPIPEDRKLYSWMSEQPGGLQGAIAQLSLRMRKILERKLSKTELEHVQKIIRQHQRWPTHASDDPEERRAADIVRRTGRKIIYALIEKEARKHVTLIWSQTGHVRKKLKHAPHKLLDHFIQYADRAPTITKDERLLAEFVESKGGMTAQYRLLSPRSRKILSIEH